MSKTAIAIANIELGKTIPQVWKILSSGCDVDCRDCACIGCAHLDCDIRDKCSECKPMVLLFCSEFKAVRP